jgi:hypothetical protein
MSKQQLQALIQQGWNSVANFRNTLLVYENTDPEGRECLLLVLNGINQMRLYPLDRSWRAVEGLGANGRWRYTASHDEIEYIAIEIVGMLIARLLRDEWNLP